MVMRGNGRFEALLQIGERGDMAWSVARGRLGRAMTAWGRRGAGQHGSQWRQGQDSSLANLQQGPAGFWTGTRTGAGGRKERQEVCDSEINVYLCAHFENRVQVLVQWDLAAATLPGTRIRLSNTF